MQPDLVWLKLRDSVGANNLFDSVRGATKRLISNATNAEDTISGVTSFDSSGFTLGSVAGNTSGFNYVAWQWKEGATQGFDIVTYTGNGANRTIAHNLGVAPSMMIVKNRTDGTTNWRVWHSALAGTEFLELNTTTAKTTGVTQWNSTTPTSTNFSLGVATATNGSGDNFVNYLFAAVAGFSAFGSYTGNGSADGPFVFCGFRPKWIMIKRTDSATSANWLLIDTSRNPSNNANLFLLANSSDADGTNNEFDILSNGFKCRFVGGNSNISAATYIFAAFAENPFKYALAR
jgi:hypothetical protein